MSDTPGSPVDPAAMRHEYAEASAFTESQLAGDWAAQFAAWFTDAIAAGEPEPNAMTLATADRHGRPSARTVLLKRYGPDGLVWFSNLGSRKGTDLADNPYASVVFRWLSRHRQVVACGPVTPLPGPEVAEYFRRRPRGSRLAAWASAQSRVIADRAELTREYDRMRRRFGEGEVSVPPHWGGWRLSPESVEFWQGRADRLHDRLRYRWDGGRWARERLAP